MAVKNKSKKGFLDGYDTYNPNDEIGRGNTEQWSTSWKRMNNKDAIKVLNKDDPMLIMEFSELPSEQDLNSQLRKLMLLHHPDRGGDIEQCRKIEAAWSILKERLFKKKSE